LIASLARSYERARGRMSLALLKASLDCSLYT
jgi:hypothetical protein